MIIVCDTSPVVALAVCGRLNLLDMLFHEVLIPQAVFDELTIPNKPKAAEIDTWAQGKVLEVQNKRLVHLFSITLDAGESEAMALYLEKAADYLLIDEKRGRKVAALNGVHTVGTLGILLLAKSKGMIDAVKPVLDVLRASAIRIAPDLYHRILKAAHEDR